MTTVEAQTSSAVTPALPPWLRRALPGVLGALAVVQLVLLADRRTGGLPFGATGVPGGIVVRGVVLGGLDALLAMGLVLLYRSGRFVSFAQGQLGAFAAVLGIALTQHFRLPVGLGIVAALAAGGAVAALSELLVVRRLFDAPRLVVTVATIGLAQVYGTLTLVTPLLLDDGLANVFTIDLPGRFTVEPITFAGADIAVVVVVPLACALLALLFRSTLGTAIRAVAESPDRARLLGLSVRRVSTTTWVVAGVLAAVTGLLRAATVGFAFGALDGPALILRGLAAAVLGGLTSLPRAFAAAIVLGVVEQAVLWNTGQTGFTTVILLGVVVVGLFLQRSQLGRAAGARAASGFVSVRPVRPLPKAIAELPVARLARIGGGVALAAGLALLPVVLGPSQLDLANRALLVGIVALSLTVLTGFGGQVSLGQWALAGLGAAVGAGLVEDGLDFGVGFVAMALLGAAVAVVVGLPALRAPGLLLAVSTLAFAVAFDRFGLQEGRLLPGSSTVRPLLFGAFDLTSATAWYEFSLVVTALAVAVVVGFRRSRRGRELVAVRDNPQAAAALGIGPVAARVGAFVVSGAMAAVAGYLYAFLVEDVTTILPVAFDPVRSIEVFTIVVIGGLGSVPGALLGVVYVLGVQDYLPGAYQPLATGAGLLVLLLFLPEGLGGLVYRGRDRLARLLADRRGIALPSAAGPLAPLAVEDPS